MKQIFVIGLFSLLSGCAGIATFNDQFKELERPKYSVSEASDRYVCQLALNPFTQEYGGSVIWHGGGERERKWVREAYRRDLDCTVPGRITLSTEGREFTMFQSRIVGATDSELCAIWRNKSSELRYRREVLFFENQAEARELDCRSDIPRNVASRDFPANSHERQIVINTNDQNRKILSPVELFNDVNQSVYLVFSVGYERDALGSAVAINRDSLVTNCHVIESAKRVLLLDVANEKTLGEVSRIRDLGNDRCVLSVRSMVKPVKGFRAYTDLKVGEKVFTVGSPSGQINSLGEGIISGLRENDSLKMIQTTAQISQGSSGGGLFDSMGNLIGITTYILRDSQNLNFAIAIDEFD